MAEPVHNGGIVKLGSLSFVAGVLGVAWGLQSGLASPLDGHLQTMAGANSFQATVNVQTIGGGVATYTLTYAKPNMMRIEGPDGSVSSDGTLMTTYQKRENMYMQVPATMDGILKAVGKSDLFVWSAFFNPDFAKLFKSTKPGATRNLRGNQVTEVAFTMANERDGAGTVYVDTKTGIARGFGIKVGDKDLLVMATDLRSGSAAMTAADFTFKVPAGAQKVEEIKPAATYAQVSQILRSSCLPCHAGDRITAGVNTTTYAGVMAMVTPGDPAASRLIRSVKGIGMQRMPKDRAPLSAEQIATLEQWIKDGAKER